jgi:hypothetical protein
MKDRCWKKFAKGLVATTNFLEVLVNDEETTLLKLNYIYGEEEHVFFGIKRQRGDYMCLLVWQRFRRKG